MNKLIYNNKKGFSLIELIVVIAIIGILVLLAAPKFLGYTRDAEVATMKADIKVLSDASEHYNIDNQEWPITDAVKLDIDSVNKLIKERVDIGELYQFPSSALKDDLKPHVRKIKNNIEDFALIVGGKNEGNVVYTKGKEDKNKNVWYSENIKENKSEIIDDENASGEGLYIPKYEDFVWRKASQGYYLESKQERGYYTYIGSIAEVKVPHTINGELVTSCSYMFMDSIVTKVVSDSANITDMNHMFFKSKAQSLDITLNTSNVTDMSEMFSSCNSVDLDLLHFNTSKVTTMQGMFRGSNAVNLDLSSFDTSNVTNMSAMFSHSKANNIDLLSFNTSKVATMAYMFNHSQITSLDISSFDLKSLTTKNVMLSGILVSPIYVKDEESINILKTGTSAPKQLEFIVKE